MRDRRKDGTKKGRNRDREKNEKEGGSRRMASTST